MLGWLMPLILGEGGTALREPLIIINLSLPPRIKYGVNSGGSPVISRVSGFLLSQE
jgi:hypothetical protein